MRRSRQNSGRERERESESEIGGPLGEIETSLARLLTRLVVRRADSSHEHSLIFLFEVGLKRRNDPI